MYGNLTRSKSNKGSMGGQFSHEFLHRQVWRGEATRRGLRRRGCSGSVLSGCEKTIFRTRELRRVARVPQQQRDRPAGGSNISFSKAAAQRLTLVSRFTFHASRFTVFGSDARTMLADFFSLLLFRYEDQHPRRAFFDHIGKPSCGTAGGSSWENRSPANLNGPKAIGGILRREKGKHVGDLPA